jgi:hypothetical protein
MTILKEAGLNRILQYVKKYSCGMLTTFRGEDTRAKNLDKNKELLAYLRNADYIVIKVMGSYIENFKKPNAKEVGEESFFVVNPHVEGDDGGKLEKDLVKLGIHYKQDSILSVRNGQQGVLIGTSDAENAYPGVIGKRVPVGDPRYGWAKGEFFSKIRGRRFAWEESVEVPRNFDTRNGRWAASVVSERIKKDIERMQQLAGIKLDQ